MKGRADDSSRPAHPVRRVDVRDSYETRTMCKAACRNALRMRGRKRCATVRRRAQWGTRGRAPAAHPSLRRHRSAICHVEISGKLEQMPLLVAMRREHANASDSTWRARDVAPRSPPGSTAYRCVEIPMKLELSQAHRRRDAPAMPPERGSSRGRATAAMGRVRMARRVVERLHAQVRAHAPDELRTSSPPLSPEARRSGPHASPRRFDRPGRAGPGRASAFRRARTPRTRAPGGRCCCR